MSIARVCVVFVLAAGSMLGAPPAPASAYLTLSGDDWARDTRYRRDGDVCVAENAR
jgi:hypothetical protein